VIYEDGNDDNAAVDATREYLTKMRRCDYVRWLGRVNLCQAHLSNDTFF
jgi:hypothetical protein